ncbi:MAG: Ig-like domain-containing protein [Thermoplasmata archaeon]
MLKNLRKIFGMGVVIACLLSLFPQSVTGAPAIELSPDTGIVGTQVIVNGTGFSSNVMVSIYWEDETYPLNTTQTTPTGTFSLTIGIPQSVAGRHTVLAKDANGNKATAQFTVIPSLTISQGSGYVGNSVTVTLHGYAGNVWVTLYWDGIPWLSVPTTNVGSAQKSTQIPELNGGYHILSGTDENGNTASAQFLVLSNITLSPQQGSYGEIVMVEGTGFAQTAEVELTMNSTYLATAYTNDKGSFTALFSVPELPGCPHEVVARDTSGNIALASFQILPSLRLNKYAGFVGETLSLSGFGYTAGKNLTVFWDNLQIPTNPPVVTALPTGSFTCEISVPFTPYGSHMLTAKDEVELNKSVTFSVSPRISVTPDHGLPGCPALVNGTGFGANLSVDIIWDYGLQSQQMLGSTTTNETGAFSHPVQIPQGTNGIHTITAKDWQGHLAQTPFTLGPSLSLSKTTGTVGTPIDVSGYTFTPGANVSLFWDGGFIGQARTDTSGDFTYSFSIPPSQYGFHTISAIDEYNVSATASFFVEPDVDVLPDSGTVGSITTIIGTGFSGNSIAFIYWDGANTYRSERTDAQGSFMLVFTVPEAPYGTHTIEVRDSTGVAASTEYAIYPSISLSKSAGHVGEPFSVYCYGFASHSLVTLVWDNVSTPYHNLTTDKGTSEISANVPAALAGSHELYVYDSNLHAVQPLTFTVLPLDAPIPFSPSGFVNSTDVMLSWSAVQNASFYRGQISTEPAFTTNVSGFYTPSLNFEITGLSHGVKYFWRVRTVDGAGNEGSYSAPLNFTVDIVPPSSSLTGPVYANTNSFTLQYTADDDVSGVSTVKLYYSFNTTEFEFYAQSSLSSGAFRFYPIHGDGVYRFYTVAEDNGGNRELVSGAKHTVILDTTTPTAFVSQLPAVVATRTIELNVIAGDTGSGVSHFMIYYSTDEGLTWEFYGNYSNTPVEFTATREGKYLFQAVGVDYAGNVENFGFAEAWTFFDFTGPTLWASVEGTLGNNGWYLSPVTVALYASDATATTIYYSLDSGNWTLYTAPFIVADDGVHTLACHAVDAAGNSNFSLNLVIRIDRTPPVTQHTPVLEWYNISHVTINFTANDGASGVKFTKVRIDNGEWITLSTGSGTAPLTVFGNGNHTLRYYSVDIAGNAEQEQEFCVRIDGLPPTTTHMLSGTQGKNGWFLSSVTLELVSLDTLSGVASAYYSIDNSSFREYTKAVEIGAEGIHLIEYYAVDVAGNVEVKRSVTVKIDTTMPTSTISPLEGWCRTLPLNLTIAAEDTGSGLYAVYYSINDLPWVRDSSISLNASGIYTIRFYAVDIAGNVEDVNHVVLKIDAEAPKTVYRVEGSSIQNGWFGSSVIVSLSAEDMWSGVAAIMFSVDGSIFFRYTGPIFIEGDGVHILKFYATDNAGNTEELHTLTICIDSTPPETTANASSDWYSKLPVVIGLAGVDANSGVANTWYRVDGGEWRNGTELTLNEDGIHTVEFYSVDIAGNREMLHTITVRIDTLAPVLQVKGLPLENETVCGTLYVSFEVNDISGVARAKYLFEGVSNLLYSSTNLYSFEIETKSWSDGPKTIVIEVTDNAGHTTRIARSFRIDNTPPTISSMAPSDGGVVQGEVTLIFILADEDKISEVHVYMDGKPVSFEREGNTVRYHWKTTPGDNGIHVVTIYVKDAAGNQKVYEKRFSVNNPDLTPYMATLFLIGGLCAAGAVIMSTRKQRKKVKLEKKEVKE